MDKTHNSKRSFYLLLICTAAAIVNTIAYYPGFMSPDTIDQYEQALSNTYTDWHPPIMALLWHVLLPASNGPQVLLILQMVLLWSSIYVLLSTHASRLWVVLVTLFTFAPFVQNFSGYIIKDTHMALSLLLASAILYRGYVQDRRLTIPEFGIAVVLLVYGGIIRPNAFPAVFPLCILLGRLQVGGNRLKTALLSSALVAAVVIGGIAQNVFAKPAPSFAISKLYMHDLTGIFVETGSDVFPPKLYTQYDLDTNYLRAHYHAATFDNIWWNGDAKKVLPDNKSQVLTDTLREHWQRAIIKEPYVYISNRMKGALYFLRLKKRSDEFYPVFPWIHPNKYGFEFKRSWVSELFLKPIEKQRNLFYMRPWFWFFINIMLLFCSRIIHVRRLKLVFIGLLSSSLLYLLPSFLIFQVDTDLRYFYWNCISCSTALLILIQNRAYTTTAAG